MAVVDTSDNVSAHLKYLKTRGVKAIGRYYSSATWKRLTKPEAAAVSAAGFKLFTVFEDSGDPKLSAEQGIHDAQIALAQAKNIGQPDRSAIYFALEHLPHGYTSAHVDGIKLYCEGLREVLAGKYKLGVYSDGVVCAALLDAELCDYAWLSASTSFEGSKAFDKSGRWALAQRKVDLNWNGLSIDTNDAKDDFGAFIAVQAEVKTAVKPRDLKPQAELAAAAEVSKAEALEAVPFAPAQRPEIFSFQTHFVQLTRPDDSPVVVNVEEIVHFSPVPVNGPSMGPLPCGTRITFKNQSHLDVKELVDAALAKIENAF